MSKSCPGHLWSSGMLELSRLGGITRWDTATHGKIPIIIIVIIRASEMATGEKLMGKSTDGAALLPLAPLPEQLCFDVNRYFCGEPNLGEGTLEMYAEAMR